MQFFRNGVVPDKVMDVYHYNDFLKTVIKYDEKVAMLLEEAYKICLEKEQPLLI